MKKIKISRKIHEWELIMQNILFSYHKMYIVTEEIDLLVPDRTRCWSWHVLFVVLVFEEGAEKHFNLSYQQIMIIKRLLAIEVSSGVQHTPLSLSLSTYFLSLSLSLSHPTLSLYFTLSLSFSFTCIHVQIRSLRSTYCTTSGVSNKHFTGHMRTSMMFSNI